MIFHSKKLEAYLNQINKIFNDEDLELFATKESANKQICIRQDFKEKFTKYFSNLYYLYR